MTFRRADGGNHGEFRHREKAVQHDRQEDDHDFEEHVATLSTMVRGATHC